MADDRISSLFDDELDDIPVVSGNGGAPKPDQPAAPVPQQQAPTKPAEPAPRIPPPAPSSAPQAVPQSPIVRKSSVPAEQAQPVPDDLKTQFEEDEKEIRQVAEKELPRKTDAQEVQTVEQLVEGLSDQVMSMVGLSFDNDDLKKRFHTIVTAYFKDLRDALETKSKMTMPKPSGGMGMTEEQAGKVMGTLTAKLAEFEAAMKSRVQDEKKQFVAKQAEKQLTERDEFERKEKASLDRTYAKATGAEVPPEPQPAPKPAAPPKVIPVTQEKKAPIPAPAPAKPAEPVTSTPPPAPAPKPSTPPPASPKSAPITSPPAPEQEKPSSDDAFDEFFKQNEAKADQAKSAAPVPKPSAASTPPPASPKPAPRTPPPAPMTGKTVVSDVKAAPTKLVGPVEELRSIALRDFRHLSKDPSEATLKIKDKIDLLENQSFAQKTAGIEAWRESPTNKLYLDILRRSLEGKPVNDVIGEMEQAGSEVLTKAEFDAIMALNRTLRFG